MYGLVQNNLFSKYSAQLREANSQIVIFVLLDGIATCSKKTSSTLHHQFLSNVALRENGKVALPVLSSSIESAVIFMFFFNTVNKFRNENTKIKNLIRNNLIPVALFDIPFLFQVDAKQFSQEIQIEICPARHDCFKCDCESLENEFFFDACWSNETCLTGIAERKETDANNFKLFQMCFQRANFQCLFMTFTRPQLMN